MTAQLQGILKKEWLNFQTYNDNSFDQFKKQYNNLVGDSVNEFIKIDNIVYDEWYYFKLEKRYDMYLKDFDKVWNEFKQFWNLNSNETIQVFTEMKLLSKDLLQEWRYKYMFVYPGVYEKAIYGDEYWKKHDIYSKKSKMELWNEFKEIWDIDINDYDEHLLNEIKAFVNQVDEYENTCQEYPRNFWEYRENGNYHSFYSYSFLEKEEICKMWLEYEERCIISDEDESYE